MLPDRFLELLNGACGLTVTGQIGKQYVYQMRGKTLVRYVYFIPANPRTVKQQANRAKFAFAVFNYQAEPPESKTYWNERNPYPRWMSGYNFYIRTYMLNN